MKKEKGKVKVGKIIPWVLYGILMAGVITIFVFWKDIYGTSHIDPITKELIWDYKPIFAEVVSQNTALQTLYSEGIPGFLKCVVIIGIAITIGIALHYLGKVRKIGSQKTTTVFILVVNFLKWVVVIGAIFMILSACGLRSEFSAAGAGIVALIIGLGSQSLVADILAGIFIVFEGDYQVGDIVILDGWRGEIQAIGVRTTKLIDAGGNIKIVNNSDIRSIINQTKELSLAKCYISTKYEDRIENIEAVIADNIEAIGKKIPKIVEGPFYKGVAELGSSSVDLLFVAKCKESDIYQVQRDLNRELKIMFDNNNIGIPFPQIVIHKGEDDVKQTVTQKTVKKAEEFTEEQHELSKDIDVKK